MKGRKWYSLKKDLQPFITWTSISTIKFVNTQFDDSLKNDKYKAKLALDNII